ncbi:MAG: type II toxin-antitoxin system VapC family toxin [Actinomycetota bacterium]
MLVDSSAFLSLEDPAEKSHARSLRTFESLIGDESRFLTTNFVFDETYTLILTRLGRERAINWGDGFLSGKLVQLVRVQEDHEQEAWKILKEFSDKDFSYTDATSFAVAESLGIGTAFALDRHFHQFGRLVIVP